MYFFIEIFQKRSSGSFRTETGPVGKEKIVDTCIRFNIDFEHRCSSRCLVSGLRCNLSDAVSVLLSVKSTRKLIYWFKWGASACSQPSSTMHEYFCSSSSSSFLRHYSSANVVRKQLVGLLSSPLKHSCIRILWPSRAPSTRIANQKTNSSFSHQRPPKKGKIAISYGNDVSTERRKKK